MAETRTIYLSEFDIKRLRELINEAEHSTYRGSRYLMNLRAELNKALVVPPAEVPGDVITMNSKIRLLDIEDDEEMTFTLVFPQDADIHEDKVSVLAPIGTAVLGYRVGDSVEWEVPAGRRTLKVIEILYQPESAGDFEL
jgi:regulator of nucleoside diphosphate kinase